MLALIKREIEDNILFFIIAAIIAIVFTVIPIYSVMTYEMEKPPIGIPMSMYGIFWLLFLFVPLICTAFGATQMYADRSKKISTFLATMATTRKRILTAKIITGLLWICVVIVPLAAADAILLRVYPLIVPADTSLLVKLFITLFLICLACYCLGLQMGWNTNKFFSILGSLAVTPILMSIIIVKGFGIETAAILLLLAIASTLRIWQKFMTTPL